MLRKKVQERHEYDDLRDALPMRPALAVEYSSEENKESSPA